MSTTATPELIYCSVMEDYTNHGCPPRCACKDSSSCPLWLLKQKGKGEVEVYGSKFGGIA